MPKTSLNFVFERSPAKAQQVCDCGSLYDQTRKSLIQIYRYRAGARARRQMPSAQDAGFAASTNAHQQTLPRLVGKRSVVVSAPHHDSPALLCSGEHCHPRAEVA